LRRLFQQPVSRVELARRLHIDEKEARRMLDPHHATKAERLERALAVLGRHAELRVAWGLQAAFFKTRKGISNPLAWLTNPLGDAIFIKVGSSKGPSFVSP
jgi:hypothetical protein